MAWRQLKYSGASVPRALAAVAFFVASGIALTGCNGVADGSGAAAQQQPAENNPATIQAAANKYFSTATPGNGGYLVGPQDVLDITVFGAPDLSKTLQVADNGTITFPLLGQIPAAGKSPSALEREIQTRLNGRYLKAAQVTVFVKEHNSQRITVQGAVRSPGVHPIRGSETLSEVIAKSGGLDRGTSSSDVIVFRNVGGARTMTRYDISAILSGSAEDPQILPGDFVVVEDSMTKTGLQYFLRVLPVAGMAMPLL